MMYVVKLFAEITIKSSPVRKAFIRQLRRNIKLVCCDIDPELLVTGGWDQLEVVTALNDSSDLLRLSDKLCCIPGVAQVLRVESFPFKDLEDIGEKLLSLWKDKLVGKLFCVRVKRSRDHEFSSMDAERFLGEVLLKHVEGVRVDLSNPECLVAVTIRQNQYYIIHDVRTGLGGYPLGTQDGVLSLLSGGFDSGVASFMTLKRGMPTHYCFCNLGGREHELAVKDLAYYLWERFGASHKVRFISIPFEKVVHNIVTCVDNAYMGVVLKRMMLRVACRVADDFNIDALVTGEAVAQVSSQTLPNLVLIDEVSDRLVLRPLVVMDKQDIIDHARKIGTETFSGQMPEYCAVISKKPVTRAQAQRLEVAESQFDFALLEDAFENRVVSDIRHLVNRKDNQNSLLFIGEPERNDVVIDVRHGNEQEASPLNSDAFTVVSIPFYRLSTALKTMDPQRRYLLYCPKGVMSRLHAAHLLGEGYKNIAVFSPSKKVI